MASACANRATSVFMPSMGTGTIHLANSGDGTGAYWRRTDDPLLLGRLVGGGRAARWPVQRLEPVEVGAQDGPLAAYTVRWQTAVLYQLPDGIGV